MTAPAAPSASRRPARSRATRPGRLFFATAVASCLLAGMVGGLLRAGVAMPVAAQAAWFGPAVQHHAFLMICGFLGTLIGIERAVAVKQRWAFIAPLASALAGGCSLAGLALWPAALSVFAGLVFVAVNVLVVRRQPAAHTRLLLASALAWLIGNLGMALDGSPQLTLPWWFAFLVLTIAAERLEMTRLMRHRPGASWALALVVLALLGGSLLSALQAEAGGVLYGGALVTLSAWLFRHDIARRTVRAEGLSRYMAVCLLLGYGWLAVAGLAWGATALGLPWRDAALHALAIGFVFSMILGHAPVILPAIARVKLAFGGFFYVPLALLHLSLALRLLARPGWPEAMAWGAQGNVVAILLFVATVAGAALSWVRQHPGAPRLPEHELQTPAGP